MEIRTVIDAYAALVQAVDTNAKVVSFPKVPKTPEEVLDAYADSRKKSINCFLIGLSEITPEKGEFENVTYKMKFKCSYLLSYVDAKYYAGSSSETFETNLSALINAFTQEIVDESVPMEVMRIPQDGIILGGDEGIAAFSPSIIVHTCEWSQIIYTI